MVRPCLHRRLKGSFLRQKLVHSYYCTKADVALCRSLGQDFEWGQMIKHILTLKAKFLEMSPFRHLEVSAPKLPFPSDNVDNDVSKCVFQRLNILRVLKPIRKHVLFFGGRFFFLKSCFNNDQRCFLLLQSIIALFI